MPQNQITIALLNFQRALVALVPFAETAGITWRDGESYDEWDGVASALFSALVVSQLAEEFPSLNFPNYDTRYPDYHCFDKVLVLSDALPNEAVFVAFATRDIPFDSIRVIERHDEEGEDQSAKIISVIGARFRIEEK